VRARAFYDSYGVDTETSEHSSISPYGFAKRKNQGSKYSIGSPKQGYTLNLSQTRIGLMDEVTWEMRRYDKYRKIAQIMAGLGQSTAQRLELDCTHQLTFGGNGTTYTNMDGESISCASADGQQLFDTDHTATGVSGGSYANRITTAFSQTALEEAEALICTWVDDNGNKVVTSMNTIFSTEKPALVNDIAQMLKSEKTPADDYNSINPYKGKYNHVVLPYLDSTNEGANDSSKDDYWGLWNTNNPNAILEISEYPTFKAAKPDSNSEDFETDGWKYKSSAAYDLGVLDFKIGILSVN